MSLTALDESVTRFLSGGEKTFTHKLLDISISQNGQLAKTGHHKPLKTSRYQFLCITSFKHKGITDFNFDDSLNGCLRFLTCFRIHSANLRRYLKDSLCSLAAARKPLVARIYQLNPLPRIFINSSGLEHVG